MLDRLVGGDRRTGSGIDESTMDGLTSGVAAVGAEGEIDELPIPCACPLLRDGWSRRASSSYSPFYDGEGVWSQSEAAGDSMEDEDVARSLRGAAGGGGEGDGGIGGGGDDGEDWMMPVPTLVADVLIEDLCFSLRYVMSLPRWCDSRRWLRCNAFFLPDRKRRC